MCCRCSVENWIPVNSLLCKFWSHVREAGSDESIALHSQGGFTGNISRAVDWIDVGDNQANSVEAAAALLPNSPTECCVLAYAVPISIEWIRAKTLQQRHSMDDEVKSDTFDLNQVSHFAVETGLRKRLRIIGFPIGDSWREWDSH